MTQKFPRLLPAVAAALLLAMGHAAPARAQASFSGGPGGVEGPGSITGSGAPVPHGPGAGGGDDDQGGDDSAAKAKAEAPPPAIPGAESEDDTAAPAPKAAVDLAPNDALFDAINRGDVAAARDALNRGAQLDARNVLGQTPTEASIDLNRNDITFLLLSMRGAASEGDPGLLPGTKEAAERAYEAARAARHEAHHAKPVVTAAAHSPIGRPLAVASPSADRGTPIPQVGFTGF